jgi:hypothetical protein
MVIVKREFRGAVLDGLWEESQYPFELNDCSGYIRMDFSPLIGREEFRDAVNSGLLGKVALKIPHRPDGDLHERTIVESSPWRFTFTITQYERDGAHEWEMVDDPLPLPDDEVLGRLIVMSVELSR